MNCGRRDCAYHCVQKDEEIEKQRTIRISNICYAIQKFADPKIDSNTRSMALNLLEIILKKEEII